MSGCYCGCDDDATEATNAHMISNNFIMRQKERKMCFKIPPHIVHLHQQQHFLHRKPPDALKPTNEFWLILHQQLSSASASTTYSPVLSKFSGDIEMISEQRASYHQGNRINHIYSLLRTTGVKINICCSILLLTPLINLLIVLLI